MQIFNINIGYREESDGWNEAEVVDESIFGISFYR